MAKAKAKGKAAKREAETPAAKAKQVEALAAVMAVLKPYKDALFKAEAPLRAAEIKYARGAPARAAAAKKETDRRAAAKREADIVAAAKKTADRVAAAKKAAALLDANKKVAVEKIIAEAATVKKAVDPRISTRTAAERIAEGRRRFAEATRRVRSVGRTKINKMQMEHTDLVSTRRPPRTRRPIRYRKAIPVAEETMYIKFNIPYLDMLPGLPYPMGFPILPGFRLSKTQ